MKHLLRYILAILLCLVPLSTMTASAFPFYDQTYKVDAVDTNRGEDQLIIYTAARGTSTGTNAYGYEVAVDENGVIVVLGGNNLDIPENGFVVSGHGYMADRLRDEIVRGMSVVFDDAKNEVYFTYNADSLTTAVNASLAASETAIENAKAAFVYADYDAASRTLTTVKNTFETALDVYQNGGDAVAFEDVCAATLHELNTLQNKLCDSYPVQYRGVWIRPSQHDADEVKAYVKTLYEAGINTVSIEGCYANSVIMNVPTGSLFEKNPAFDYDVLQAYIDACKVYGMECHLWMPIMKVGNDYDGDPSLSVLAKKPEWASLNQDGTAYNESGFAMIDPANKEARAYLIEFYKYIVENYEIDCLELDYIRYYARSGDYDYGYTEAAFAGFEEQYHYGVTPTYNRKAFYWDDWVQYRCDCITAMVREIREMLDETNGDVLLSADVAFPASSARSNNYQEFETWLEGDLLDILHPMAYGDGYADDIALAAKQAGDKCIVVPGLGSQSSSLGAVEMEKQARENNAVGAYGEFYFEAKSFLREGTDIALAETVYRNAAIAPFHYGSQSIRNQLAYMQGRLNDVIVPLGGVTKDEAAALNEAITNLINTVHLSDVDPTTLSALHEIIDAVQNHAAKTVLRQDLYRAERITCVEKRLTHSQLTVEKTVIPIMSKPIIIIADVLLTIIAAVGAAFVLTKPRCKKGLSHDDQTV